MTLDGEATLVMLVLHHAFSLSMWVMVRYVLPLVED